MKYQAVKTYGHSEGLSVAFRQHRADSHCRFLHGYALSFKFTFECSDLDSKNWCLDFGSLKPLREWLHDHFDHRLIVAEDDPQRGLFQALYYAGVARVWVVPQVSCEMFAKMAADYATVLLMGLKVSDRVALVSVEVAEHSGNSAVCIVRAVYEEE